MKGILIAVFLGVFGGYRFYKGQKGLGFLYLFTGGLCLIGWAVDILQAVFEYVKSLSSKKHHGGVTISNPNDFYGKKEVIVTIAGCFAECKKDPSVKRYNLVKSLPVGFEFFIETAYYDGRPYFLVSIPAGLDVGAFPNELSSYIKNHCPDADLTAVLINKDDADHPLMKVTIEREKH